MKIFALHNYDTAFRNSLNYKQKNCSDTKDLFQNAQMAGVLENYNSAKAYYNKKLDNDGKLFDDEASFLNVLENPQKRNVLFTFLRERAQQELLELSLKTNLTEDEKNKKEGLKEIIEAFPSPSQAVIANRIPSNLAFCGVLTPDQKEKCQIAIHGASVACGAISAALGEGAAIGADTILLRGTQALMFLYLQNLLDISIPASLLYAGRQYVMGAYLGVRGAQILIGWLGLGAHGASLVVGAPGNPTVSFAVRGVNSFLSSAITEKMGWGYVRSYENDTMTTKSQFINSAIYAASMGILHFHDNGVLNPSDFSDIQEAISKIPKENVSVLGEAIHNLLGYDINLPRAGIIFAANFLQGVLTTKNLDEESKKKYFKNLLAVSLLSTILYEVFNIPENNLIEEDATRALQEMQNQFNNPANEVSKDFYELQQKIINDINLDDLSTRDFIKQFKDKTFLINLAISTGEATNILADKWRKRNIKILKDAKTAADEKFAKENTRTIQINSKLSPEEKQKLDEELNNIILKAKSDMQNKTRANHALGIIAGYDSTKELLNKAYITPVKNKDENSVPGLLLFYGPSGLGKTAIGTAIAEDAGTRFKNNITLGIGNEKRVLEWIKERLQEGEKGYNKDKRYSIIQLNEIDGFLNDNPDLLDEFLKLIDDCAKKYHTTIFLTTNNPLGINEKILNKVELTIPMPAATRSDIRDIVQHYLNGREIDNFNLDEIVDEFESVKPNYMYSNAQIKSIIEGRLPQNHCTQDDFINIIRSVRPRITKEINEKFEKERKILEKGNV